MDPFNEEIMDEDIMAEAQTIGKEIEEGVPFPKALNIPIKTLFRAVGAEANKVAVPTKATGVFTEATVKTSSDGMRVTIVVSPKLRTTALDKTKTSPSPHQNITTTSLNYNNSSINISGANSCRNMTP